MHRLYEKAMLWELVEWQRNPMQLVEIKGISKRRKKPIVLTVEQYFQILALIPEPYRTMVPSSARPKLPRAVSSTAHNPTAAGERPNTNRVAAPVPPQTAIATQAAWSEADGYLETAPVRVEVEQSVRE